MLNNEFFRFLFKRNFSDYCGSLCFFIEAHFNCIIDKVFKSYIQNLYKWFMVKALCTKIIFILFMYKVIKVIYKLFMVKALCRKIIFLLFMCLFG